MPEIAKGWVGKKKKKDPLLSFRPFQNIPDTH